MTRELLLVLVSCGVALTARQCCPKGEIIMDKGFCNPQQKVELNCTNGRMLLKDVFLKGDKVSTLDAPNFVFVEDPKHYCIGEMYKNHSLPDLGVLPVALVCFEQIQKAQNNDIETSGILTLISVFFLGATFAVYIYLPQLRDLQGMCYICMCISMALGFLSLGILQLGTEFRNAACTVTGFLIYTWMMATFFWMNVICINMYRTVLDATYLKKTERKQYFWYSCYAWGATLLFLTVCLVANFVKGDHWKPGIGKSSCWFYGRTETWIFFYGPIAILIASNIILFTLSSIHLWRKTRKYEVNKLNNLKHKFLLSLKLFLVMGLSWTFEIASFAHGEDHIIWKIMDIFNCLQGVIIFILLVLLRKRAIQGLANENCLPCVTRPLSDKLNPHDDSEDQEILADDTVEVRLN